MRVQDREFDAVIIGAGPAGVSCAVWLARLGLAPLLLEAGSQVGGLCRRNPFPDEWNATLPGLTGAQVADNLALSLAQASVPVELLYSVGRIGRRGAGFTVARRDGSEALACRHVVLATGVQARALPGAQSAPPGRILVGPGEHIVAQDFSGLRVAVLGGGDNAFENALYVAQRGAESVHVHARHVRAQQQFVRRLSPRQVQTGPYEVDAAAVSVNGRPYDLLLVFYGWEPRVDFADGLDLRRSSEGFLATEAATAQTSCGGVYAIGEVAQRQHPCVVTALADGVTAAKAIQARIESGAQAHSVSGVGAASGNWH